MNSNEKFMCEDGADKIDPSRYRSMVGGLMYLTHSRPDIAFAVNVLTRFMQTPSKDHFGAAKRVLRYVSGTIDYGLWYTPQNGICLEGYSDSDWAGSIDDRKSVSAYGFNIGSGAISWCVKKQNSVALSSTEAEYISATAATCQAVWLRRILEDLGFKQMEATTIWCDSRSAIHLSKNPALHGRSKHIELKHHFIRDMVAQKQVELKFCNTEDQTADVLTKALCREKFTHHRFKLGVKEFELREGVDVGGEFCSNEFNMFCETHGIKRHLTAPFTPEQNGVCERKNRTVVEMAQCMLQAKGMPSYFWAEAVATAVHILNLSPTKAVDNKTPIHMWSGERPNVNDLRIFGCLCYGLTPAQQRHKFEPNSEKCILIGYSSQTKGYRLYNPKTKQIITRRDVKFFEESAWDWSNEKGRDNNHLWDLSTFDPMILDPTSETNDLNEAGHENNTIQVNDVPSTSQNHNAVAGPSNTNEVITDSSSPPQKVRDLNDVYSNCHVIEDYVACQFALNIRDPIIYEEAILKEEWKKAMKEEISSIEKNGTWDLIDAPENKNIVGLKWLYKTKVGKNGEIVKHKARLVAKGYSQQKGIDFHDTFAPVARFETVRTVIAVAASLGWKISQLDVKSAFLNGILEEEIYVEQPQGFEITGQEDKVYKLHKALYGLKQAPRAWYSRIDTYLASQGFIRSYNEPTLYVKKEKEAADTPMNSNEKFMCEDGADKIDPSRYRSMVGGLMYLTHSRPDIAFAVNVLTRFMQTPSKDHFGAAKRVLRYVSGTIDYGLWYTPQNGICLEGYSDSDWAGSIDDRKSVSAYGFNIGSGAISWCVKKQNSVALSSTEAEYISATAATCQAVWLRRILEDLGFKQMEATTIWCDSRSAIHLSKNPALHGRSKHIELKHHFIRDMVAQKQVELKFCNTEDQTADVLTKALCREKFTHHRFKLGVKEFELREGVDV
ncbi:hypothetical protein E3N88_43977 [Mikania micrantha]|uniref:Integrase catalytic domain-containing protein n=2 Tax=Mikania micrantha TaxID=192012 RepID=A0A5N6LDD6_9ASTR|nr:hypothetical protein E3N88_43977 [Mikania micrantha]